MNFITGTRTNEEHVELKYCERCGGLFLREPKAFAVYCPACTLRLSAEPALSDEAVVRRRGRPARLIQGRKTKPNEFLGMACIDSLYAVAMEAGL
ncbi:MAG TPA: hypothetical protein VMI10_11785 [Terriglobales bacterium]|nr:hypothetical protein [Terriglobales bacterium]